MDTWRYLLRERNVDNWLLEKIGLIYQRKKVWLLCSNLQTICYYGIAAHKAQREMKCPQIINMVRGFQIGVWTGKPNWQWASNADCFVQWSSINTSFCCDARNWLECLSVASRLLDCLIVTLCKTPSARVAIDPRLHNNATICKRATGKKGCIRFILQERVRRLPRRHCYHPTAAAVLCWLNRSDFQLLISLPNYIHF